MKELILMIVLMLSLVLLTGCYTGTAHLNNEETRSICVPYCVSKNMTLDMDNSITYKHTIVCSCESEPIFRNNVNN